MKKLKYYSIGILVVFFSLMGCESDDDFLKEDPETFYTIDNVFSSAAQVDQVLISIYTHIRWLWVNPQEQAWVFNWKYKGTDMYDVPIIRKSTTFSDYSVINPDHGTFYNVYKTWYYVISNANMAIQAADMDGISWSSDEEKAYALAQARFFRAYAYKNLAELFGGVPLVTEVVSAPRYDFVASTRAEVYQYAIDEMEAILDDLPETTTSGGRLVKGAAQHNLSELYLALGIQQEEDGGDSQASYTNSVAYASELIDGGIYSLMDQRFGSRADVDQFTINVHTAGVDNDESIVDTLLLNANYYWDLFQEDNVNYQDGNTECIWAAQIDYEAYKTEDTYSRLRYSRSLGPVFRDIASAHVTGTLENVGGRGICRICPTMYARDMVYEGEWSDDMRNSEAVLRRRIKGNQESSPYYKQVIPWEEMYGDESDDSYINNTSEIYPISCKAATDSYTGLDDGEDRSNLFRDDYIIRLSETILLRAEAKQRLGNKSGAAEDINLLRARAQCGYMVTAADMDDDFNMILDERARELIYEEARWNTLLRMGGTIAVDRIREYAHWPETQATLTFDFNLWPIPNDVIDSNKDVELAQNPGWEDR